MVRLLLLFSYVVTDRVCNSSHVITTTLYFLGRAGKETSCKYEEIKRFIRYNIATRSTKTTKRKC